MRKIGLNTPHNSSDYVQIAKLHYCDSDKNPAADTATALFSLNCNHQIVLI